MRIILTILLFIVCSTARANYPGVRSFPRAAHGGGSQTWAITQDSVGRMYFGNKNGLLKYNGSEWGLSGVPNGSTIRSILVDYGTDARHPRIYLGASDEFGYQEPDSITGRMRYHTLTHLLQTPAQSLKEIWHIHKSGSTIWFIADRDVIGYNGSTLFNIPLPERVTASALIDDKLYVALHNRGLYELRDGRPIALPGNEAIHNKRIQSILPYNTGLLIVTDFDGLFLAQNQNITKYNTEFDDFLKENQVFCATNSGSKYAFGTVRNGVVTKDFSSGRLTYSNTMTGLQNNTVLSMYFDRDNNLWLGLDNGIDLVLVNSPVYNLLGTSTSFGAGYAAHVSDNTLYLGTNQGLFTMPVPRTSSPVPPSANACISGQIWDITEIDGDIFICSDTGISYGRGNSFREIEGIPGTWCIRPLASDPEYALASSYEALYILHRTSAGWQSLGQVEGYHDIGGKFAEDAQGNVWIAHWLKGIYRLKIDPKRRVVTESRFFNTEQGLPTNHNNGVNRLGSQIVFSTEGGFYRLAPDGEHMLPDTALNNRLATYSSARIHTAPNGDIWYASGSSIGRSSLSLDGRPVLDTLSYCPMKSQLIPGFEDFTFLSDQRLIVSCQEGFYDVALDHKPHYKGSPKLFFSRIYANGDSLLAVASPTGVLPDIELDFANNSLRFEIACTEYRSDNAVSFSYYLENYDKDWSNFTSATSKEYTQLHEGKYRMRVRAYNNYTHRTDEQVLQFSIMPPWYRSTTAKIIYTILFLALCYGIFRFVGEISRRASMRVAIRKESEMANMQREARQDALEKENEIANLKGRQLELDIKHKTEELSNITMNVVRKNEILLEISNRLDRLNESGSAPREITLQIGQIQALIRDNISHDDDWKSFMHNFDFAYEDFTKKLIERHPALTPTELRVCCYIKMGLSSKEIAPLFNISYRSVEMTRYRLRKKLGLERETNLTEYLQRI